jgi:hypothetical protein
MYGSAAAASAAFLPIALTDSGWRLLIFPVALAASGVASTVFGVTQGVTASRSALRTCSAG